MPARKYPKTPPQSNKITSYFSPTKRPFPLKLDMDNNVQLVNGSGNQQGNVNENHNLENGIRKSMSKKEGSTNSGLKKCFTALVDRKQVNLELEVLQLMLRKEMQVPLETLDPELATILPYLLVHFIKTWPGWQKSQEYFSGQIKFKDWYDKFNSFIMLKLNYTSNDLFKYAKIEVVKEIKRIHQSKLVVGRITDRNAQTDNLAPKGIAPFSLEIFAPPIWLNSIVFSENSEGSVILKQHAISEWDQKTTDSITLKQIITWPHVTVHFISPILRFSRENTPYHERQISVASTSFPQSTRPHIEEVISLNVNIPRVGFTVDYIKQMANELLEVLETLQEPQIVFEAFITVIEQFLLDLEEINICINDKPTIASNTSVLFNIGRQAYFRNKKLSKGAPSRNDISYMELLVPRMKTTLYEVASANYSEYLEYLRTTSNPTPEKSPRITFGCNFCMLDFDQVGELANHLRVHHKMEQPVLCVMCKKNFFATFLTDNRYAHTCAGRK